MYKSVQSKLSPVIVNGFIDGTHPIAEDRRAAVPTTSPPCAKRRSNIDNVVQIFDGVHEMLVRHCVPAVVIEQLVRQALYFVDALLVNALLLRRALCDEATTRKMKSNLIVLERWAVSRGLQNTLKEVDPVLAAIELLHVPFTTLEADADLRKIKSLCRPLTAPQVEKLIRSSEQNVSPVMIDRIIHLVLQGTSRSKNASVSSVRSVSSRDAVTSNDDSQIFIDTFATEPLRIPPTVVSTSVVLPASLNLPYVNTPTVSECQSEV